MQKNLVKLSFLAQKVLQRGRVPVLQLVDLPSILTKNNGRKTTIFVPPCILPSHTGFKNIFILRLYISLPNKVLFINHPHIFMIYFFLRYSWIVHPLAYRDSTNSLPDNCVDALQWGVLNVCEEPHFKHNIFWGNCQGLELFNDFTYAASYNPELSLKPVEASDFSIPCFNGK